MTLDDLSSTIKLFEYYKQLADNSFAQLEDDALFWKYNEDSNSIATIINHISGNIHSRWTDFLSTDGEKEWRNRDQEFELNIKTRTELIKQWEDAWAVFFDAMQLVNEKNIDQEIYIRNKAHTIHEAIQRQLAHYASHIGQIIYIAKMATKEDWSSLSIPKGGSKAFNESAFAERKRKAHFTDQFKSK